jgi:hypothetical protein
MDVVWKCLRPVVRLQEWHVQSQSRPSMLVPMKSTRCNVLLHIVGWVLRIEQDVDADRGRDRRRLVAHKQWFREGSGPLASLERERAEGQRALRRRSAVNRSTEDAKDEAGGSASSMRGSKRA